ncbi:MAG: hypothetical protein WCP21_19575, partial [Armatimonadota bacterium]
VQTTRPPEPPAVWESLSSVLHQQLTEEALLLWRYERRSGLLRLLAAAPASAAPVGLIIRAEEPLRLLADGRLELAVQPSGAGREGGLAAVLAGLGVGAAVTAVVGHEGDEANLLTVGFRQPWELEQHSQAVLAFAAYLRHCQQVVLPPAAECHWWAWQSRSTRLWRKDYRPSAIRTVHDLNEVLLDAARPEGLRVGRTSKSAAVGQSDLEMQPTWGRGRAAEGLSLATAHHAAELMEQLEGSYGTAPTACDDVELLSQALLLTRGAFELCDGGWPGWMSIEGLPPDPLPEDPAQRRHHLIDWLAGRVEAPIAAA